MLVTGKKINLVGLGMLLGVCAGFALLAVGVGQQPQTVAGLGFLLVLIAGFAQTITLATTAKNHSVKRYATYALIISIGLSILFFGYMRIAPTLGWLSGMALFVVLAGTGVIHTFFNVEHAPALRPRLSVVKSMFVRKKSPV